MLQWHYVDANGQNGPVSLEDLATMLARSHSPADVIVWHTGLKGWAKAGTLSDLDPYTKKEPPPLSEAQYAEAKRAASESDPSDATPMLVFERLWFFVILIELVSIAANINPALRELVSGLDFYWRTVVYGLVLLLLALLIVTVLATSRGKLLAAKWLLVTIVAVGAWQEFESLRDREIYSADPLFAWTSLASTALQCIGLIVLFTPASRRWLKSDASPGERKRWATTLIVTLGLILVVLGLVVYHWLVPDGSGSTRRTSSSMEALEDAPKIARAKPSFRVTFAQEPETTFAPSECGPSVGGGCRYDRPVQRLGPPRLKIQSLNDVQIQLVKVVVNDNEKCTINPVRQIAEALKSEGRDAKALEAVTRVNQPSNTMKYGDVTTITLSGCTPARVRITTDHGEAVYDLHPDRG